MRSEINILASAPVWPNASIISSASKPLRVVPIRGCGILAPCTVSCVFRHLFVDVRHGPTWRGWRQRGINPCHLRRIRSISFVQTKFEQRTILHRINAHEFAWVKNDANDKVIGVSRTLYYPNPFYPHAPTSFLTHKCRNMPH